MEQENKEFNIPYYIFEEIGEYLETTASGKCKSMKWENTKSLLRLAVINNRITRENANFLIEKYNREKQY